MNCSDIYSAMFFHPKNLLVSTPLNQLATVFQQKTLASTPLSQLAPLSEVEGQWQRVKSFLEIPSVRSPKKPGICQARCRVLTAGLKSQE
jgi:hypothetical protein